MDTGQGRILRALAQDRCAVVREVDLWEDLLSEGLREDCYVARDLGLSVHRAGVIAVVVSWKDTDRDSRPSEERQGELESLLRRPVAVKAERQIR